MYSRTSKKISESIIIGWLLLTFMMMASLYLPFGDQEPSKVIQIPSIAEHYQTRQPKSVSAAETKPAAPQREVIPTPEEKTEILEKEEPIFDNINLVEENSESNQESSESLINSYINEIVTTYYPELDQITIQAIVYNESHYTPEAINSSSGTMGLMQISPKWHTQRAANLGVTDLLDAYGNILVGCDILAETTRQTGSFTYALDVFAGGYAYANSYINSISPARAHISETVNMINNGTISF